MLPSLQEARLQRIIDMMQSYTDDYQSTDSEIRGLYATLMEVTQLLMKRMEVLNNETREEK